MWWKVVAIGFAVSLSVEAIQLITHRGWFDVDNLLLNTAGTAIGYALYRKILYKENECCGGVGSPEDTGDKAEKTLKG